MVCIFLDLAKAFDSLPHSLVLESLARVGVCGSLYDWFADYLTGRSQRVVLEGHSSSVASVTSGVPQGSILGPLLFSLSIDPIASVSISISAALGMFADDIVYWMRVFNDSDMLALQCDFDLLCDWIHNAGLRLNSQKTKCLVISRKRKPPCPSISVNGSVIEQVSSFKYLGVTISSDLSWSPHVANVCCKAKKLLGFLYRGFRFADRSCLAHLYKMLVRPILEYSCSAWDPHQKLNIMKLERVQNFAARLATGERTGMCLRASSAGPC